MTVTIEQFVLGHVASSNQVTVAITASNSNKYVAIGLYRYSNADRAWSSCTLGGDSPYVDQAMTKDPNSTVEFQGADGNYYSCVIYYIDNPPAGADWVRINLNGGSTEIFLGVYCLSGDFKVGLLNSNYATLSDGVELSDVIAANSLNLILDGIIIEGAKASIAVGNIGEQTESNEHVGSYSTAAWGWNEETGTSATHEWEWTNLSAAVMCMAVVGKKNASLFNLMGNM